MKFEAFLNLLSEGQEVCLIYEGFAVTGDQDALRCILNEDVYEGIVTDIEAAGDLLKVWVKEDDHAQTD
jgi:hypothetical protein